MEHKIVGPYGRLMLIVLTAAAAVALAVVGTRQALGGGKGGSERKVKVTAAASKQDAAGNQVITLTLDVNKGWHIYANPVRNDKVKSAETTVTVSGKSRVAAINIEYPPGVLLKDETVGDHLIYEGKVIIRAQVQRAPGDAGPLELTVSVNACDADSCLPPGKIPVKVP